MSCVSSPIDMSHAQVHIDADFHDDPLVVHHENGKRSIQISELFPIAVWLTGTPDDLRCYAERLLTIASSTVSFDADSHPPAVASAEPSVEVPSTFGTCHTELTKVAE